MKPPLHRKIYKGCCRGYRTTAEGGAARQSCDPKVEVSLERDREAFLPAVLFVGRGVEAGSSNAGMVASRAPL